MEKREITTMNQLIKEINKQEFILIASLPGMGKSTLAINIINKIAASTKDKILYFNFETPKETLKEKIKGSNIKIFDDPGLSIEKINAICKKEENIGLIVIDYLQLITSKTLFKSGLKSIDYISYKLKTMSINYDVPIIILSQLVRTIEYRENKKPKLEDLRVSGSIMQDADKIIFLYRDKDKNSKTNDLELIIAKNRGGSLGVIKLKNNDEII